MEGPVTHAQTGELWRDLNRHLTLDSRTQVHLYYRVPALPDFVTY